MRVNTRYINTTKGTTSKAELRSCVRVDVDVLGSRP